MSTLTEKDIKKGAFVQYYVETYPTCLAMIVKVNHTGRTFRVQSLDGMGICLDFEFDVDFASSPTRKLMNLVSKTEAREFVAIRDRDLREKLRRAKKSVREIEGERRRYKTVASKLGLIKPKSK